MMSRLHTQNILNKKHHYITNLFPCLKNNFLYPRIYFKKRTYESYNDIRIKPSERKIKSS